MLEKLFYYLQGYLILELCGDSKERFINLCKNREIEIIHIFSINSQWYCKIKSSEYKHLKVFLKKTGCNIKIKKKIGLPFLVKKIRERRGLIIGIILFLIIITQCSGRIWHISVAGGFCHTREQILRVMKEELGVYGGVAGTQIDCFEIEKRLRLDYNEIGWISVEKRGCRLHVMLNESMMPKLIETLERPSHIVAAQDGIVRKIEVLSGVPRVKAGDEVKKGDILISGVIPVQGDYEELLRNNPVVADGAVYIESEFSYSARISMSYEQKNFVNERSGLEFFMFGRKLFSYIPRYSEGKYDIISIDVIPYAFEDYEAPLMFRKFRLMEYETEPVTMTEAEAKTKAKNDWERFISDWEAQGVHIIKANFSPVIQGKICSVTGEITACGNFISYQEILEEEWMTDNEHSGDNP